jgi:L-threonylcarbamoyladenylate synthase
MNIVRIDQNKPDENIIASAAAYLNQEKVIVHPTETVYGLAGLYDSQKAIEKIVAAKSRAISQPFSIMVDSVKQMVAISGQKSEWLYRLLDKLFPAPLTVLLPRLLQIKPEFWNHFPLLGFRYPDHPLSIHLLRQTIKPIVSTSANISGKGAVTTLSELSTSFLSRFPLVLDGGKTLLKRPSTVIRIDVNKRTASLVRAGAIPWDILEKNIAEVI